MNYEIKITNQDLYNEKVIDVDLDFHKGGMNGDVAIEVEGEGERVFTGEHGSYDYEDEYGFVIIPVHTYNVHFDDNQDSNDKGFEMTLQEAKDYIKAYNGTSESYFEDYKGGTVSVVCNETGERVYQEEVR